MLDERLRHVLFSMNFVNLYRSLEEEFRNSDANANYIPSQKEVLEILESRKYKARYFKSEKFYKIAEIVNGTLVQLNLAFPGSGHKIECILHVENKTVSLKDGGPFTLLVSQLTEHAQGAKNIPFSDRAQLERAMDGVLFIYESIKKLF